MPAFDFHDSVPQPLRHELQSAFADFKYVKPRLVVRDATDAEVGELDPGMVWARFFVGFDTLDGHGQCTISPDHPVARHISAFPTDADFYFTVEPGSGLRWTLSDRKWSEPWAGPRTITLFWTPLATTCGATEREPYRHCEEPPLHSGPCRDPRHGDFMPSKELAGRGGFS